MATDNTPPRLRLIGTIAVIVVTTLISLDFVFKSYYGYMTDVAQREKLAPTTAKYDQRAVEAAAFAGAKVPINEAMAEIAKGTRGELVEPKPSEDMGAMTGWSKLPKQLPLPPSGGPAVPGAMMVHGPDMGDAGAMSAGDGGPLNAPMNAADGGAHAPAAAADAGAPHLVPKPPVAPKDAGAQH